MTTEIDGLDIHYSFDNSFPDNYYPKYNEPVTVPKDAVDNESYHVQEWKTNRQNDGDAKGRDE